MNKLDIKKQTQIVAALVEGNSIRATCRMTEAAKGTVLKLLAEAGKACVEYQNVAFRNLPCTKIQCDEIWAFCYAKSKNVPEEKKDKFGYGMSGRSQPFAPILNLFPLGIYRES